MQSFNFTKPVQYNAPAKSKFHSQGRAKLRKLAEALALPKGTYEIRSNAGGIAVSGEVTLHHDKVYIQVFQSCLGPKDYGILIRTCKGRKDYTGGKNFYARLSALNYPVGLARYIRIIVQDAIWMETPAEYRSIINGARYVLDNRGAEGTCLVPLETSSKVI